ncbi:MAG: hypothetical protein AAFR84_02990 [Pseudomonadota bacterium]
MLRKLEVHNIAGAEVSHFVDFSTVAFTVEKMRFSEFSGWEHTALLKSEGVSQTMYFEGEGHAERARAIAAAFNLQEKEEAA